MVAGLAEAARFQPDALLIGIAPQGGGLPASWHAVVADALTRG